MSDHTRDTRATLDNHEDQDNHEIHVLHVVGHVTDEVFSFLGPASRALARSGHVQQIVVVDAPQHRHNVRQFDEFARVVRVPKAANLFRQWRALVRQFKTEWVKGGLHAVHVHGLIPCLLVSAALRSSGPAARVVYSPYGSKSPGTLRFAGKLARSAVHIEGPVADVFFSTTRNETLQPLIVTAGRKSGASGVEAFSRMAVLLSGEELSLSFHWLGGVAASAERRLSAAGVAVSPAARDNDRAALMATGWMYVAPCSTRRFPLSLVQAMAAGLPCIALDCAPHRDVIEDGKTGFLCTSEHEMVQRLAMLVDDVALRMRVGAAARAMAIGRFSESNFQEKLLTAYSTVVATQGPASMSISHQGAHE